MSKNTTKKRQAGTSGVKALIASASVAATMAGWAILPANDPKYNTTAENQPPQVAQVDSATSGTTGQPAATPTFTPGNATQPPAIPTPLPTRVITLDTGGTTTAQAPEAATPLPTATPVPVEDTPTPVPTAVPVQPNTYSSRPRAVTRSHSSK